MVQGSRLNNYDTGMDLVESLAYCRTQQCSPASLIMIRFVAAMPFYLVLGHCMPVASLYVSMTSVTVPAGIALFVTAYAHDPPDSDFLSFLCLGELPLSFTTTVDDRNRSRPKRWGPRANHVWGHSGRSDTEQRRTSVGGPASWRLCEWFNPLWIVRTEAALLSIPNEAFYCSRLLHVFRYYIVS